jgi:hypothetical protein
MVSAHRKGLRSIRRTIDRTVGRVQSGFAASRHNTVIFMGESGILKQVLACAQERGYTPVELPHPGLACVVADRDVLNGRCTPSEAAILRRARAFDVPCLTPEQALLWLTGAAQ